MAEDHLTERKLGRLLVAGAAGFIGSHFVKLLRRTRPEVEIVVLDKLTYAGNPANLAELEGTEGYRFVRGDVADGEMVDHLAGQVDAIVNFAAETHVDRSLLDPFAFVITDVLGTGVLAEAARKHGHEVFLLVSTDEVYGDVASGRSAETDAFRPRSPYSASKAGGELLAWSYHASHDLPLIVTRGSNNYGPNQFPEKIIPLFITNAIDGMELPIYGDGSAVRDYIYIEDHCRGIDAALHRGALGEAYNLGTGRETSGNEVAAAVVELLELDPGKVQRVVDRAGHDYRYALDVSKAREQLDCSAEVGFREGMERTVAWFRQNEGWWRPLRNGDYWEFYKRNYRALHTT